MKRFLKALYRFWGYILVVAVVALIFAGGMLKGACDGPPPGYSLWVRTNQQYKDIHHAVHDFRHTYGYKPGDLPNPEEVLPGCDEIACVGGNGDGVLGVAVSAPRALADTDMSENDQFWIHLVAAGLMKDKPIQLPLGGQLTAFDFEPDHPPTGIKLNGGQPRAGLYLLQSAAETKDFEKPILTSRDASHLDRMLDDGVPDSGGVQAIGIEKSCYGHKPWMPKLWVYNEDYGSGLKKGWWDIWPEKPIPCFALIVMLNE